MAKNAPYCHLSLLLAAALLLGMALSHLAIDRSHVIAEYKRQLPSSLQALYSRLSSERLRIYYCGYFLGFLLSMLFVWYAKGYKPSTLVLVSSVIAISSIVSYYYYILTPKSDYLLNHIQSSEQNRAWLAMYRHMQVYCHGGMVLGILAAAMAAFAFRCPPPAV